ncbi:ABC transporter permease [Paenibacillus sp. P96]|uniref:ABC transporter permease n=2 Tax=Paenibacillus zeirhizosphaerae TaxID=2987519 RepID=A0ABT9FP89_9BACL|nr:ABC transporter permease [Paenibacillus sp. P96]MDP4096542.1 ABC transporter permease [Paenibacillus sp. P96]
MNIGTGAETHAWMQSIHKEYKRRNRAAKWRVRAVQLAILIASFLFWELAGRRGWIDVLLFSYPSKVFRQIYGDAVSGELWGHLAVTVGETAVGFVMGTLLGTGLAILIWWFPFLSKVLDPYMVVFNSMPKVALGPIFIVMFGAGFTAILMTTLSIIIIITTLVVYNSFREVDANYIKVVRSFGGSKRDEFQKVVLPASFAAVISTLKVNVGMAWIGVIVGEFLAARAGLGYLIIYGFQVFNFTLVMSSLLLISIIAALMYQGVAYMERRLLSGRHQ